MARPTKATLAPLGEWAKTKLLEAAQTGDTTATPVLHIYDRFTKACENTTSAAAGITTIYSPVARVEAESRLKKAIEEQNNLFEEWNRAAIQWAQQQVSEERNREMARQRLKRHREKKQISEECNDTT